ncbi:histidyl-tRNA synthetase [Candidatus Phytoplasma luffae]|uniref:Histidine--tRNA ligase n=1 Tax=Loofah witches'-broom phytoplasma TaxID=35773 RepID=A0A975FL93_LOWBP|nr:histidine--tRNA ligase [Candidatus Phytoplasma luffae]QTX03046.1 histidyl-tRNA synthetase [Candidatus Phytoplasma luffae]
MKKIKGTHDLIFDEIDKWHFVEKKIKHLFDKYNFCEIRTPILEYSEVFQRSAQYSEMVLKEIFHFLDKKGRKIALRPEGTASIVRSYVENKMDKKNELHKFYYYGPFFRYERPQKGRYRQFHQFGCEVIGTQNLLSEIEIFFLIDDLFKIFSFNNYKIIINTLGDPESLTSFLKDFIPYIKENKNQLCDLCLDRINQNILRIFDCKKCVNKQFLKNSPLLFDYLTTSAKNKFEKIIELLDKSKICFEIDLKLVRGLDYYTDIVFEIAYSSNDNKKKLILGGGGSYNSLIKEFNGSEKNSIGFAIGMERFILTLEEQNCFHNFIKPYLDLYLFILDEKVIPEAFMLLRKLRQNKIKAEMNYKILNFNKQFFKILENKPIYILFIGEKEIKNNQFTIKKISDKKNYILDKNQIINFLKKELKIQ